VIRPPQGDEELHGKGQIVEVDRSDVALLVAAAEQGDEGAWGEIVDRYTPLVVSVVLRYRLSSAELQDVTQTVWLRLVEHLGDLREPRALPMWLITTAKREALRQATASSRVRPTDPQDEGWSALFVVDDDQDADLVRDERHAALMEGFATLSPRQRELLMILSEDPPVPYAEISRRTGIPVGAIGPTRARAVARLRRTPAVQQLVAVGAEPSERQGS
jgi:RNA polymerase sigma factor (sigma-70 family)